MNATTPLFLNIPGLWNLVWIVPLAVVTGLGIGALFIGGKTRNPEGPPYASFDTRLDAHIAERGIGTDVDGTMLGYGEKSIAENSALTHFCGPECFEPGAHMFRPNNPGDFIS